jgi:hypothetical protein
MYNIDYMYTSASPGFTFFGLPLFLIFEISVTVNIEFETVKINEESDETGVEVIAVVIEY